MRVHEEQTASKMKVKTSPPVVFDDGGLVGVGARQLSQARRARLGVAAQMKLKAKSESALSHSGFKR